jgi:hypothetical protein
MIQRYIVSANENVIKSCINKKYQFLGHCGNLTAYKISIQSILGLILTMVMNSESGK